MKIISLDQSTKVTAWAIFDDEKLIKYGEIKADIKEKDSIIRMKQMYYDIKQLFINYADNDSYVFFEGVQYQNNQNVYSVLSQLQGLVMAALFDLKIPFMILPVVSWRHKVGIQNNKKREFQKQEAIKLVKEKFGLDVSEDAAEAILIGVAGEITLNKRC